MHKAVLVFGDDVESALAPYDGNLEVAPYKIIDGWKSLFRAARWYKKERKPFSIEDWTGEKGGIGIRGLWHWSRFNPNYKWDWYKIGGRWNGAIPNNRVLAKDCDFVPCDFLDPDGFWHKDTSEEEFSFAKEKWGEVQVTLVDCHY